uniref:ZF-HD dimerization-type domain-containing protein n=1 Tax=Aegilops tauschii subsp. strangulata TaxID=200361 RepID=A0A453HGU9_AEGTS
MPSPPAAVSEDSSGKKRAAAIAGGAGGPAVKYRECLKNHAAAIGGNATDGCGEFMPSGEEGSLEALKCSACGCHRNFHRKELDDFDGDSCASHGYGYGHHAVRRLLGPAVPHHHKSSGGLLVTADHYGAYAAARALPPPPPPPLGHHHQIIMPLNKRFRTKFTAEQKGRMLEFAENVGWRLQKLDDAMVQHFCQEIGVKRRVLKVWMHNNKHNLASRPLPTSPAQPQSQSMPLAMSMPMPMQVPPSQPGPSGHRGPSSPHAQGELKLD